jgi:hypothetical protein
VHASEAEKVGARGTAALLTAAAYGPMNHFAFVAPSTGSAPGGGPPGVGLFARARLAKGQAICPYFGPVATPADAGTSTLAPNASAEAGQATGGIAGAAGGMAGAAGGAAGGAADGAEGHGSATSDVTSDADGGANGSSGGGGAAGSALESSVLERPLGLYAAHSGQPNAQLERWEPPAHIPLWGLNECLDGRGRCEILLVVATEPIEAGGEVRIDHTIGRRDARWRPPPARAEEGARPWRTVHVPPPPGCGSSAVFALFDSESLESLGVPLEAVPLNDATDIVPRAATDAADGRYEPMVFDDDGCAACRLGNRSKHTCSRSREARERAALEKTAGRKRPRGEARKEARPRPAKAARPRPSAAASGQRSPDTDDDVDGASACDSDSSASAAADDERAGRASRATTEAELGPSALSGGSEDDIKGDGEGGGLPKGDAEGSPPVVLAPLGARPPALPLHALPSAARPRRPIGADGLERFVRGDLVEVQEAFKISGPRSWYTGFVAYAWWDDVEPWTGYAIQFIHDETSEHSVEHDFERRVPANRVRGAGGSPAAADTHLASNPVLLAAARSMALKVRFASPWLLTRGASPSPNCSPDGAQTSREACPCDAPTPWLARGRRPQLPWHAPTPGTLPRPRAFTSQASVGTPKDALDLYGGRRGRRNSAVVASGRF